MAKHAILSTSVGISMAASCFFNLLVLLERGLVYCIISWALIYVLFRVEAPDTMGKLRRWYPCTAPLRLWLASACGVKYDQWELQKIALHELMQMAFDQLQRLHPSFSKHEEWYQRRMRYWPAALCIIAGVLTFCCMGCLVIVVDHVFGMLNRPDRFTLFTCCLGICIDMRW